MALNITNWKNNLETSKNKSLHILIINIIVSLISCSACFFFFNLIKEKAIYPKGMFDDFLSCILVILLYCYLSVHTNIYIRKKFNLINAPMDLLKQFFPIICFSFLWMIIFYLFFNGFSNEKRFKDLIEFSLYFLIPYLIFYTIHLITYKLKQIFNNIIFEKIIFVALNTLLFFLTLEISATIITVFDISKISIIYVIPILFAGLFSFQFSLLNEILYTFDIKKENFNKDIATCTLISSIIYLISIANEIMFTILKADFENAKLIAFLFLFVYSLIMCIKTKILKPILFTILLTYLAISIWDFKLNNFNPLNNYLKIKKEIWNKSAIRHFPNDIPTNVTSIEYDYSQHSFFGSESIYLVFSTDENYIKNEIAKHKFQEIIEPQKYNGDYEYTYRTIGYDMSNFKIYTIKKDGIFSYGIAVNEKSNQLMYFYSYPD